MKKLILSELLLLFLATTFISDNPPPGWYQQTINIGNRQITDIFFLDSLSGWVVTNGGSSGTDSALCLKTVDGGNNWTEQIKTYGLFNAVQFIDYNTGYIAADRGPGFMLKTTNSGVNWFQVFNSGDGLTDLFFINKDTGWATDPSPPPFGVGIIKTTNGGINWTQQLAASFRPQKLFFINSDTGWAGSADWKLYRTTNSGQVWVLQYTFSGAPNVFFPTKDTGYYYSSLKTTNGGFNWFAMNNGQSGKGLFFINGKTGWASDLFSIIQKTTDGQNWYNQTTPIFNNSSITFADSLRGWAGGTGIVHTTDGGGITGIQQIGTEIPTDFKLYQNYPNPFNPATNIKYQIVKSSIIILKIFDIQGKELTVLVNQKQQAGTYEVTFDGTVYSSGVYFYSLMVDGKIIDTKRMVLVK